MGWLATALLRQVEQGGERYQNSLLILDDFPVNSPNGQSILLNITDPAKRTCYNQYLQGHLDVSRLNIIFISNEECRSLNPEQEQDPTFAALKTRFIPVRWPGLNERQKRTVLTPYFATLLDKYKLPAFHRCEYFNSSQLRVTYDPMALLDMGLRKVKSHFFLPTGIKETEAATVREIKLRLESALQTYIVQTILDGNRLFRKSDFKKAALKGHPESMDLCAQQRCARQRPGDLEEQKKKALQSRMAKYHTTSGNIDNAKKWWLKSLDIQDWTICAEMIPYLSIRDFTALDQKLGKALLEFPEAHANGKDDVSEYLYKLGTEQRTPDLSAALKYLSKAVRLGHHAAQKSLYEVSKDIEEGPGFENADIIACHSLLSEHLCMISGVPRTQLEHDSKGVLTLCFSKNAPLLVFEIFLPKHPTSLALRMVRYNPYEKNPQISDATDTLRQVSKEERYASWILPNGNLLNGLANAELDAVSSSRHASQVSFVRQIMEDSGLKNLQFGWWRKTAQSLQRLVDTHVKNPPVYTKTTFPLHPFTTVIKK